MRDLYYNLAYTYKENNQPDSAFIYLELYNNISEWVSQQNQQIEIAKAQSSFDLQKKQQQVNKLLDTQQRNKQITIFIFIVLILVVIILITLLRVRQKVKINKLLTSQKETLQEKTNLLEIQQQQIEQQRDLLSLQNKQLQESQQIISCQNKEIQQKNQNLEEQIRIRTQNYKKTTDNLKILRLSLLITYAHLLSRY
ncbi:hypothetical protein QNI16_00790 [Cytophagaceae bacterium YF14B1]|uniref:Transmembrane protein n=1 Tax=Xanthocytophaga flava TaxID=3048013 RepID=A0AAE3QHN1_9BACT|nr:hypothetical protein [Xanthocytophaga flavus]MDJ1478995.1 hypothetical protein [Xanthocytophaga flavus]